MGGLQKLGWQTEKHFYNRKGGREKFVKQKEVKYFVYYWVDTVQTQIFFPIDQTGGQEELMFSAKC